MRDRCVGAPTADSYSGRADSTAAHEGGAIALLAARWELVPRRNASSANAKRPLSMEDVPDRGSRCWSRNSGRYGLGGFCPGGPTRRREQTGPTKTGVGEATGTLEVGHMGRVGG